MNIFNLERAFKLKEERNWEYMYIGIDFHDVIFPGYYDMHQELNFYPHAKEVLRHWTERSDIVLIAWTSSHAEHFNAVSESLKPHGIRFDYLNSNPECPTTKLANFDQKFYFNVILDDKAGFEGDKDWLAIINELKRIGQWN